MRTITLVVAILATAILRAEEKAPADTAVLDEAVVTGVRSATDIRHLSQTVSVIRRDDIENTHRASFLPLLTEEVPGLFITSRSIMGYGIAGGAAGNISIRGLSGGTSRMLVLIDGHPQYSGLFGHPVPDAFQSLMAERIEVLRGPSSVLYGSNAMGGVLNIVTRARDGEGVDTRIHAGYGSFNTFESEISNSVKKGGFSSFISGQYDRSDGHRSGMGFQQYGGYGKVGYEFSEHWSAGVDLNVTHFDASQPGSTYAPLTDADQSVTRGMTSVYLNDRYEKTSGGLSVFYNWGNNRVNDGYGFGERPKDFRFKSRDDMAGISAYQSVNFFKGNTTTFGLDFYSYGGNASNEYVEGPQKGTTESLVDKREYEAAGYVDFRQVVKEWLILDVGFRLDRHFTAGTQAIPQFGATFVPIASAQLRASVGKGFRYPTIKEMYMFSAQNPDLQAESLWNYEISWSHALPDGRLRYGVNLFHIDAENIILALPNPSGAGISYQNSGTLKNSGVEIDGKWFINGHWSVNTNYSYLYMKNPVIAAPEHKAYLGGRFTGGRWNVSTGLQYVAGLYTSVTPEIKETFLLWNIRASFKVCRFCTIWINGENILDRRYEVICGYPMPGINLMGGVDFDF